MNAIWSPALVGPDGQPVPGGVAYRMINASDPDEGPVTIPPNGLSFIWGDASRTTVYRGSEKWCIGGPAGSYQATGSSRPPVRLARRASGASVTTVPVVGTRRGAQAAGLAVRPGRPTRRTMFGTWATLDCDVPYVKVPRISVIFTYPVSAAGGHFASDDKNGDGEPDGEPGVVSP